MPILDAYFWDTWERNMSATLCNVRRVYIYVLVGEGVSKYVSKMNVTSRTFVNTRLVFIRESSGGKFR